MGPTLKQELESVLPAELPRRAVLLSGAARHAELVLAANERLNLTRLVEPRDVAVKHVLDSVLPWRRLLELAPEGTSPAIADLGSGAGWPGVPLALLLPHARVLLVESIQKKAAFLAEVVRELADAKLATSLEVAGARIEELLARRAVDLVAARAVGSARDLLRLLKPVRMRFRRLVLYKGAGVEEEFAQAAKDAEKLGLEGAITFRGELPDGAGARALLEYWHRA